MKKYLKLYYKFLQVNLAIDISFRTSFISIIIMDLFFYFSLVKSTSFIFNGADNIVGINHDQMMLFLAYFIILNQMQMSLFSSSYWMLAEDLKNGKLDYTFLRPAHPLFTMFFAHMKFSSSLLFFVTVPHFIYWGIVNNLTPLQWALAPVSLCLSMGIFIGIEILVSLFMFWTIEGVGINFMRIQLQSMARWPSQIYTNLIRKVFTIVLPILVIGNFPLQAFRENSPKYLGYMVITLAAVLLAIKFTWSRAKLRYESASS